MYKLTTFHSDFLKMFSFENAARGWFWASVLLLIAVVSISVHNWVPNDYDIGVYLAAAQRLKAGSILYNTAFSEEQGQAYLYPPAFASLVGFIPGGKVVKLSIWVSLIVLLFGYALRGGAKLAGVNDIKDLRKFYLFGMMLLFYSVYEEIKLGQADLFVLSCLILGFLRLKKNNNVLAGVIFALAAHLKVIPIVLLPILLLQRDYRAVLGMLGGLLAFVFLPYIWAIQTHGVFGGIYRCIELNIQWFERLLLPAIESDAIGGQVQYYIPNTSFHAVLHRLFGEGTLIWRKNESWHSPIFFTIPRSILLVVSLLIPFAMYCAAGWVAWKGQKKWFNNMASLGLAFTASQMANMLYWDGHYVGLLLVLVPMFAYSKRAKHRKLVWYAILPMFVLFTLPSQLVLLSVRSADMYSWNLAVSMKAVGIPLLTILILWFTTFVCYAKRVRSSRTGLNQADAKHRS
ncbi:MAG: glycosyltransferase family 87 protein [Planctomycetota bacterium]